MMRSRRYLLSVLGTTAVVALGAGAATAATGSKGATSRSAAPRTMKHYTRHSGNCPGMGAGHSSGMAGSRAYRNI